MTTTVVITDQVINRMALAMWEADAEEHRYPAVVYLPAWERARDLYRRRARAAAEAIPGAEIE